MFHHHEQDRQLTEAERAKLLSGGEKIEGMVSHTEPTAADRRIWQVRVVVWFKEQRVEFTEELDSLYQPAPGTQEAQRILEVRGAGQLRHPDRVPKMQVPLSDGSSVPVRYDAAHRTRLVIDVPALQRKVLHDYIEQEKKRRAPASKGARTGPPWVVPAHCPNCGAPVDQAKASHDADPHCQFCSQPIPVTPVTS